MPTYRPVESGTLSSARFVFSPPTRAVLENGAPPDVQYHEYDPDSAEYDSLPEAMHAARNRELRRLYFVTNRHCMKTADRKSVV